MLTVHSHNFSFIRKKRHDTCLPTGGPSTAKPEGSDTVAQPNSACGTASRRARQQSRKVEIFSWNAGWLNRCQSATCWSSLELFILRWLPLWHGSMCVTAASTRRMWMARASAQQSIPSEAQPEDTAACLSLSLELGTLSRPTRPEEATQSRRGRLTQHSGTAPRHNWVQSQSGRACCAMGGGLRLRPSQLCSLLSCY